MKEILFRGKTYSDKWVYGCVLKGSIDNDFYILENVGATPFCINPETVGQFSGLTDKNGKKIFEGDIVKTKYGRLCVVEWRSTPCFCGFDLTVCANWDDFGKAPSSWDLYMPQNLEIVGNIHDNKELLGE